ncbi:MAG: NAD(P)-dependent glycerol-3-phosphate dehydrogenase [Deltaproteobacteria bacterium]|nr:NAD(P)-dependent glycerol-3-phosphate dehydrogenase [Deltaproteobacteria bacterium]
MSIGIIGAGGWGTALAVLLCRKHDDVSLWCHSAETLARIRETGENAAYLPSVKLPDRLQVTGSLETAASGRELLLCVTPSHFLREVMTRAAAFVTTETIVCCGSKGIEESTLMTMGDVLADVLGNSRRHAFLSGPTFALEVAQGLPAAVTAASAEPAVARKVQQSVGSPECRVYTSTDVVGVQLGGVIKNVIAIAAGVSDGLELGHNARAALITRGLAEMTRLAVKMGADPMTLSGLPGLGDLVLTCTGHLSRNRNLGFQLGQGRRLADIVAGTRMVAEGVRNTRTVHLLAQRHGVEMPIVEQMYGVLYEDKDPMQAVRDLMRRTQKAEAD